MEIAFLQVGRHSYGRSSIHPPSHKASGGHSGRAGFVKLFRIFQGSHLGLRYVTEYNSRIFL